MKHSERGIMSFLIWCVTIAFQFLWVFFLQFELQRALADENGLYQIADYNSKVGLIVIGLALLSAVGVGLGISGLMQADRARGFSAFGTCLNGFGVITGLTLNHSVAQTVLCLLTVFVAGIWVFFDAEKIGVKKTPEKSLINLGPVGWAICTWLLSAIVLPVYLIKRPQLKQRFGGFEQSAHAVSPAAAGSVEDVDQQLRKLARLKEEGIISQTEFDQKKRVLLDL